MSRKIQLVNLIEENGEFGLRLGKDCAKGEELVDRLTFEPSEDLDGPSFAILASIAESANTEGFSVGDALGILVDWAFKLGWRRAKTPAGFTGLSD